jgi:predicted TIM-barrel fold metal-dependent hydrolase
MNMSLDFSIPPGWLHSIPELIRLCPDTRFILEHCGNVDPKAFFKSEALFGKPDHDREQWIADMKAIASERNVACGISGVVTRSPGYPLTVNNLAPAINHCLDIFGPDRVMFASDWPWCLKSMELRSWVNILKKVVVNRSYQDQKKLFHDNALKFYNI